MSVMQEIEDYDFDGGDVGSLLSLCVKCRTSDEASRVLERYRAINEFADKNLGYMFGYCASTERKRLYKLFPVAHPVFGARFGRDGNS